MSNRAKRSRKRRPPASRSRADKERLANGSKAALADGSKAALAPETARQSGGGQAGGRQASGQQASGRAGGGREGGVQPTGPRSRSRERRERAHASDRRQTPISVRYGERPRPPWHPLPLSELLILVGAIGVVVGFRKGVSHGGPPLFAGIAAVALGTLEVTLREHRSGYRSHTVLLAALPVVVFHSVIALVVAAFARIPPIVTIALFALDLMLFLVLFRLLRTSFLTARTRAAGRS